MATWAMMRWVRLTLKRGNTMKYFMSLICFLVSLAFAGTSLADWQCTASNARGMVWVGYGVDHAAAKNHALRKCAPYSRFCGIVNCSFVGPIAPAVTVVPAGRFACTVYGRAGGHWTGVGATRSIAIGNAVQLCRQQGHPPCVFYPGNCRLQ